MKQKHPEVTERQDLMPGNNSISSSWALTWKVDSTDYRRDLRIAFGGTFIALNGNDKYRSS